MSNIDARKIAEAADDTPFVFTGMDGDDYEMPNVNTVANRDIAKIQRDDIDTMIRVFGRDAYEALMDMTAGVAKEIIIAWYEHGGETGKAGSRSERTQRNGARSNQTSRRGGSGNRNRSR